MVAGINSLGVNKQQNNAFLKGNKSSEKALNNLKYLTASGVIIGGGIAAGKAVLNNPNNSFVTSMDKNMTKGAEFLANGGLKDVYQKTKNYAGETFSRIESKLPNNNTMNKIGDYLSKAKNIFNKGLNQAKKFAAPLWNKIKGPVTGLLNTVKNKSANLLTKFAKLPGQYKVAGVIGALVLTSVLALLGENAYQNGKIDQKYEDALKM